MGSLGLYLRYIGISIQSQMEYKASFIMMSLGHLAITFIEFLGMVALFNRFGEVQGWSLYEVAVFYGVINVSFAIAEGAGRGYDVLDRHIRSGTFDRMLLRPRSLNLQIIGSELQMMRVGRLIQGLLVMIYGLVHLQVVMGIQQMIILFATLIGGTLFFMGMMIIQATISFWSIQSLEIVNVFTYGGVQMAQYPMDIYKKWFQKIFTYFIPMSFVSYYPLLGLLRNENLLLATLSPLAGVVFFLIANMLFRVGTRFYCSTGS